MNKIFLSGNLTRDPEVRYSQSGTAYARFGVAVKRQFSKEKDEVDFFNLTAFNKIANFCGHYLNKGSKVLVEGRLQNTAYEKDGEKHTSTDVIIDNIEFAGGKSRDNDSESPPQNQTTAKNQQKTFDDYDDNFPF